MNWSGWLGLLGPVSIGLMLVLLGLLSRRFGRVTGAAPWHFGFYLAALLIAISVIARAVDLQVDTAEPNAERSWEWLLLYDGLPAIGLTLGLAVAWRYWSWLLAERN